MRRERLVFIGECVPRRDYRPGDERASTIIRLANAMTEYFRSKGQRATYSPAEFSQQFTCTNVFNDVRQKKFYHRSREAKIELKNKISLFDGKIVIATKSVANCLESILRDINEEGGEKNITIPMFELKDVIVGNSKFKIGSIYHPSYNARKYFEPNKREICEFIYSAREQAGRG